MREPFSEVKIYTGGTEFSKKVDIFSVMTDFGTTGGCASVEFQNKRQCMEDFVLMEPEFCDDGVAIGVFDGNGGFEVAEYIRDNLKRSFKENLLKNNTDYKKTLKSALLNIDLEVQSYSEVDYVGSTAAVAIISDDKLITANIGDSEIVLIRNGEPIVLSEKHNFSNEDELNRVKNEGGEFSKNNRLVINTKLVNGSISISRTLGNKNVGKVLLGNEPYVNEVNLSKEDEYLILASDGLWNFLSYQEVADMVKIESNPTKIACLLKQTALNNGSKDNISIVVTKLNGDRG